MKFSKVSICTPPIDCDFDVLPQSEEVASGAKDENDDEGELSVAALSTQMGQV